MLHLVGLLYWVIVAILGEILRFFEPLRQFFQVFDGLHNFTLLNLLDFLLLDAIIDRGTKGDCLLFIGNQFKYLKQLMYVVFIFVQVLLVVLGKDSPSVDPVASGSRTGKPEFLLKVLFFLHHFFENNNEFVHQNHHSNFFNLGSVRQHFLDEVERNVELLQIQKCIFILCVLKLLNGS